ncbi:MAG: hypothetical protein ABEL76_04720 [Bradymonadaceae bacterium]
MPDAIDNQAFIDVLEDARRALRDGDEADAVELLEKLDRAGYPDDDLTTVLSILESSVDGRLAEALSWVENQLDELRRTSSTMFETVEEVSDEHDRALAETLAPDDAESGVAAEAPGESEPVSTVGTEALEEDFEVDTSEPAEEMPESEADDFGGDDFLEVDDLFDDDDLDEAMSMGEPDDVEESDGPAEPTEKSGSGSLDALEGAGESAEELFGDALEDTGEAGGDETAGTVAEPEEAADEGGEQRFEEAVDEQSGGLFDESPGPADESTPGGGRAQSGSEEALEESDVDAEELFGDALSSTESEDASDEAPGTSEAALPADPSTDGGSDEMEAAGLDLDFESELDQMFEDETLDGDLDFDEEEEEPVEAGSSGSEDDSIEGLDDLFAESESESVEPDQPPAGGEESEEQDAGISQAPRYRGGGEPEGAGTDDEAGAARAESPVDAEPDEELPGVSDARSPDESGDEAESLGPSSSPTPLFGEKGGSEIDSNAPTNLGDVTSGTERPNQTIGLAEELSAGTLRLIDEAYEMMEAGNYDSARDLARSVVERNPDSDRARELLEEIDERVEPQEEAEADEPSAEIEDLSCVPETKVSIDELSRFDLDHRAGFVFSLVDGEMSFEDILDPPVRDLRRTYEDILELSSMSREETLEVLRGMKARGILEVDGG